MIELKRFEDLKGQRIGSIILEEDQIIFNINTDEVIIYSYKNEYADFVEPKTVAYRMYHDQDCCESVYIESIVGDIKDIINSPILVAEKVSNKGFQLDDECAESCTWTFYKLDTIKGGVTIRWYGSSNGYYSESVSFVKLPEKIYSNGSWETKEYDTNNNLIKFEDTPVLRGKDAERFNNKMREADKNTIPKKEYDRMLEIFKSVRIVEN